MAFSLAALGAGLGQGIEAIYRQRQQQAALDLIRQQQRDEQFVGSLPGSIYMPTNSPFGSRIPTAQARPLNTAPPVAASAPRPNPLMPGTTLDPTLATMPPAALNAGVGMTGGGSPGIASATGAGSGATGLPVESAADASPGPRTLTEEQQDALSRNTAPMSADQTDELYRKAGAAESYAGVPIERTPPPQTQGRASSNLPARVGMDRPGPQGRLINLDTGEPLNIESDAGAPGGAPSTSTHSPEVHAAANAVGVSPSHQIQFSDQQYNQIAESLFRQPLTFGELVSRMQKARPGADPGTIGRAAIMIYKLIEQGDAAQNNMGFRVLSSLAALDRLKEQSRYHDIQAGLGQQHIAATERGQDIRADTAAAGRAAAGERQDKSIAAADTRAKANRDAAYQRMLTREGHVDARQARALADRAVQAAQAAGNRATASRISAIRAQIAAIAAKSPAPGSADQQKLDDLGKQLSDLAGSLGGQ